MALPPHKILGNAPAPTGIEILDWRVTAIKSHIVKAADQDRITKELDLHLPDMLFANNELRIQHRSGFELVFNAVNALRLVDNKRDLFKVSYADAWARANKGRTGDLRTVKPYDWTFSTDYAGTLGHNNQSPVPTTQQIDIEALKRPDPILFYNELVLFEDELADNGSTQLSVRVRVMPACFFVLMRYILRVDKVLYRIRDTRVYHAFGSDVVLREQSVREDVAENIEKLIKPEMDPSTLANVQWLSDHLPLRSTTMEALPLASQATS